jgi:hypothetical protein
MTIRLLIILSLLSFNVIGQTESEKNIIWRTIVQNIIDKNLDSLLNYTNFPLQGDWAGMGGLGVASEKASRQDFIKSFDKIFIPEIIADLKKKTVSNIGKSKLGDGAIEYSIAAFYSKISDGFKDEEGMILRIKKIRGIYRLYLIQGVS